MKPVARGDIHGQSEAVLEKLFDADEIERVETTGRIIIQRQIHIARRSRLVAGCRSIKIERDRAHRADGHRTAFEA